MNKKFNKAVNQSATGSSAENKKVDSLSFLFLEHIAPKALTLSRTVTTVLEYVPNYGVPVAGFQYVCAACCLLPWRLVSLRLLTNIVIVTTPQNCIISLTYAVGRRGRAV